MFSFSPFEQFEINGLYITNSTVYMLYAILVYMLVYNLNITNSELVPGR